MRMKMTKTSHSGIFGVDGGYFIRARVKDPRTGKLKEVNCTRMGIGLKEAKALREQLRTDALEMKAPPAGSMTLTEYARSWFERGLPNWKRSTQERYANALEHILPYLGGILVDQVRRSDVEEWKASMTRCTTPRGRRYAAKTINGWLRVLTVMLGSAVADFNLDHDPTYRVKELPERNPYTEQSNCLQATEVWPFLKVFEERYPRFYSMVVVALFSGLRWGEMTALEWKDLDITSQKFLVNKAQFRGTASTTKTGVSRSVPVNQFMLDVLRQHRQAQEAAGVPVGPTDLIFPSRTGGYRYSSLLRPSIRSALKEIGIEQRLSVHGLRRTFNNLMRQAVTDTIVVQAMTGHSSDRMTEHYSFVADDEKHRALDKLFEKLGPGLSEVGPGEKVVYQVVYGVPEA